MRILALDASARGFSIALGVDEAVYIENDIGNSTPQSQQILATVNNLLVRAQVNLQDLTCIAFGHGPGSFTGVRLVSTLVQALSYTKGIPLVPISSLQILAQGFWRMFKLRQMIVLTNAFMGELYAGIYHYAEEQKIVLNEQPDFLTKPSALQSLDLKGEWAGVGEGWAIYAADLQALKLKKAVTIFSEIKQPDAQDILPLARFYYQNNQCIGPSEIQPVYLRDAEAWQKKTN